jgi:predicted N-acetyltransferase YhbS
MRSSNPHETAETSPSPAVTVREAAPADHPAIHDVIVAAYGEYAAVLPPPIFDRYLADVADVSAHARTGRLFVAERAGTIVGSVSFFDEARAEGFDWPPGWAGLRALGVDPAARGLGVGRALMRASHGRALALGAPVLCLHTGEFMTAAIAMYEAMGFRRVPEFDFEGGSYLRIGDAAERKVMVIAYRLDL